MRTGVGNGLRKAWNRREAVTGGVESEALLIRNYKVVTTLALREISCKPQTARLLKTLISYDENQNR